MSQFSPTNVALVEAALEATDCSCHPDTGTVKTYNGWKEFDRQVHRGEKALVSVPTFIATEDDNGKVSTRPWKAHLFCECQTMKLNKKE